MQPLQVVPKDTPTAEDPTRWSPATVLLVQWVVGTILVFVLGTWLVWWALHLQRMFVWEEIRSSCQRLMPETVERCVDTVVIQRGGARR